MTLTLGLMHRFLEEILGYYEYKNIKDQIIKDLVKVVDSEEQLYHIEGDTLWKIKSWRESIVNKEKLKQLAEQEKQIIDLRKDALQALTEAAEQYFDLKESPELAQIIAYKMLKKKNITGAKMMGVDISDIPESIKPYTIMTEKGGVIVL